MILTALRWIYILAYVAVWCRLGWWFVNLGIPENPHEDGTEIGKSMIRGMREALIYARSNQE